MRMTRMVGPRGLSVLIFAALVALALAVVGWIQHDDGVVPPLPSYSSQGAFYPVGGGITR
jgi:hypothetical protein